MSHLNNVNFAFSSNPDAYAAVSDILNTLGIDIDALVFFCSPSYDLQIIARTIKTNWPCPAIGCTTAGEILFTSGFVKNSIVAVGFSGGIVNLEPVLISHLNNFSTNEFVFPTIPVSASTHFGLLLIDGLSMMEERITAAIYQNLRIPLIGGSAGDNMNFKETYVYSDGQFLSNAAVLGIFKTIHPFKTFMFQHIEPTDTRLVITEADVKTRTVFEINGEPAAEEYARLTGYPVHLLSSDIFAANPVMLKIGGSYYVRSISKLNSNGSLTFFCAIENGLVLTLGKTTDITRQLEIQLKNLKSEFDKLELILGCDCILRRLELENTNSVAKMNQLISSYPFIGFSTFGEQYGGLHINQTLTGIALGVPHG
ncbi:FIST C-terminal domain-containing protein [Myxococcota bacterium]|nr:FIST C-terminal domain-containing protein [Myxococcota bacterium]MBU1380072.1 FIST C-terminal domain-containing protein [Myxococcota bacterium]MBU1495530.1 FIST C-terminal domain-containing protein [Myxococcota bacterium]